MGGMILSSATSLLYAQVPKSIFIDREKQTGWPTGAPYFTVRITVIQFCAARDLSEICSIHLMGELRSTRVEPISTLC